MNKFLITVCVLSTCFLIGCDVSKVFEDQTAIKKQDEAKAIGGACRQINKSLEDCYALNQKISKNFILIGWKDMDIYMRDNKLQPMTNLINPKDITKIEEKLEQKNDVEIEKTEK